MLYNFLLLTLSAFTASVSTRQLYMGEYNTQSAAITFLLGLLFGCTGVLIVIFRILGVQ